MKKNGNSLDQRTFDKLRRLYIIALSTIALSVIISQILIRKHLSGQESDSTVINVAGRQRMLSQKLTKDIVSLSAETNLENRNLLKNKIKETLHLWELSHHALQNGNDSLRLPNKNSKKVIEKYNLLNPVFDTISEASKSIITKIENNPPLSLEFYIADIEKVKANEATFLAMMDDIVNQYDIEAEENVAWLRQLEMWLTALTLLILLGEFLFIFWPAAKSVKLAKILKKIKSSSLSSEKISQIM